MKIGYISADFGVPVFGFKGASIHVREMVRAFMRLGHGVHIVSSAINASKLTESEYIVGGFGLNSFRTETT